jgi:hypothetical protein
MKFCRAERRKANVFLFANIRPPVAYAARETSRNLSGSPFRLAERRRPAPHTAASRPTTHWHPAGILGLPPAVDKRAARVQSAAWGGGRPLGVPAATPCQRTCPRTLRATSHDFSVSLPHCGRVER